EILELRLQFGVVGIPGRLTGVQVGEIPLVLRALGGGECGGRECGGDGGEEEAFHGCGEGGEGAHSTAGRRPRKLRFVSDAASGGAGFSDRGASLERLGEEGESFF